MSTLIDLGMVRFVRRYGLPPPPSLNRAQQRLLSIALSDVSPADLHRPAYEAALACLLDDPVLPEVCPDEAGFAQLVSLTEEMEAWESTRRENAFRYALYHLRMTTGIDPYGLQPLADYVLSRPLSLNVFRRSLGILCLAWQIKMGGQLVLCYEDMRRAHALATGHTLSSTR